MPRPPRDPRARLERPGERPLLQGHLKPGGRPATSLPASPDDVEAAEAPEPSEAPEPTEPRSVQPAAEGSEGEAAAVRGKATRGADEVATRRHLEGAEQGPS